MTKAPTTSFGHPLSPESKKLVKEVRLKLKQPIHPTFDTDFNVYRFVMAAERLHKKDKDIIESAAAALNNHLRLRKALGLDTSQVMTFDENPIFQKKLMPRGEIQKFHDSCNRLLWYIEYASITVESIAYSIKSSDSCKYQFLQFEYMLRQVMEHEEKTGKLSSLRHIVDMTGYEINPFTMLFVSSGTLAYYSQLFHFENYPELVTPAELVNIAKWIHVPYKLARAMMPAGFADRFRLYDDQYLDHLKNEIDVKHIPVSLGGENRDIKCLPAVKVSQEEYWQPTDNDIINALESLHISARKSKFLSVDAYEGQKLSWYFKTDGDVFFGVFFQAGEEKRIEKDINTDNLEMIYPFFKLTSKIVHEQDSIICEKNGRYYVVFCNHHSWLNRRTTDVILIVTDKDGNKKRVHSDGTFSPCSLNV